MTDGKRNKAVLLREPNKVIVIVHLLENIECILLVHYLNILGEWLSGVGVINVV